MGAAGLILLLSSYVELLSDRYKNHQGMLANHTLIFQSVSSKIILYFYAHLVDSDMTENRQKDKRIKPYELLGRAG